MNKINYDQMDIFKGFYFEDSYLLNIECGDNFVSLNLLAVLTPTHPFYHPPLEQEHHCYKNINIDFVNAKEINWLRKNLKKIPSELDEIEDYGNIDVMWKKEQKYHIEGEWGTLEFLSDTPNIQYL